jgi:hypothetical protein
MPEGQFKGIIRERTFLIILVSDIPSRSMGLDISELWAGGNPRGRFRFRDEGTEALLQEYFQLVLSKLGKP